MIGCIGLYPHGRRFSASIDPSLLSSLCKRKSIVLSYPCFSSRTFCFVSEAQNKKKKRVLVISGPTGAGKSRLALELAKRLNGEIVSADSVQVYRGLDVGSAKPLNSDRKEVPHHLLDILHPSEEYSAGKFFEDARKATDHILEKGRVPIIVGGTGLYLRWYIYGKPSVPVATEDVSMEVWSELEHFQNSGQWDAAVELIVRSGDPEARHVAHNDWYRLRRSLEIIKTSGSPPSAFELPYNAFRRSIAKEVDEISSTVDNENCLTGPPKSLDYDFLCFFLTSPRIDLYRSIDLRCEEMLMRNPGILKEASWLLDIGLLPNSNCASRAIGYRQAMEYLSHCREVNGLCSPGEFYSFLSEFQKASRNFAKRQMTWFRNELIYHWVDASKPLEKVLSFIHDSYHDRSGALTVPDCFSIRKDVTGRRESKELKAYCPKNRLLVKEEDCLAILSWIQRTQTRHVGMNSKL